MKDEIVVKRYSEAFVKFCAPTVGVQKAAQELKSLKNEVIHDNPGFLGILESREVTFSEKNDFMDRVLAEGFSQETRQFIKLLLLKGRIDKILDITEYIRKKYSLGEELEAVLRTSFPLDLELIRTIKSRLEEKFKKKFKLYINLDGSLLGGIQVVVGNTVLDGSVRRRLDDLKEKLKALKV
jgi:F-type H+-transporting ATPase subunit delta